MNGATGTDRTTELGAYAAAVRAALADIPPEQSDDLLEDLEEHLAEVTAEDDAPLVARLGPPEDYARDLRNAAGLPFDGSGASVPPRRLAARLAQARGSRAFVELMRFLPELRPAWWVVRAWAAVTVVDLVFVGSGSFPLPTLGLGLVGLIATVAAVVWSVRLGMRARAAGRQPGPPAVLLNGLLAVLALVGVVGVAHGLSPASADPVYYEPGPGTEGLVHDDGTPITNIYPYSTDGRPLTGVLLYDQDGRPIDDLADTTADGETVRPDPAAPPQPGNAYPQRRSVATFDQSGERLVPMEAPAAPTSAPATTAPSTSAPSTSAPATATPSAGD